jgi:recombinational DNA repair protein RecT
MSTELAKNQDPRLAYRNMVENSVSRELQTILEHNPAAFAAAKARIAQAFRACASQNPQIYECTPASVVLATIQTLLTGLAPGGVNPTCYLLPRRIKGTMELQWQASHRGLVQLALPAHGVQDAALVQAALLVLKVQGPLRCLASHPPPGPV